jgi:hypothetical protein
MASSVLMLERNICALKSGPASTTRDVCSERTQMLERRRLSRVSVDVQTAQSQPIIGTPLLVPVPRNVMVSFGTTKSNQAALLVAD